MEAELGAGLVAVDVAGVRAEVGETGADCAADGEFAEDAGDGRPELARVARGDPAVVEGAEVAGVGDHDLHGQSGGRDGVMERRGGHDLFGGGEEFAVLIEGEAAHERGAGEELFVGGLGGELGEEVHR